MDRRLIEEDFPIKEIGKESSREKGRGHISTFHIWWARRPLAASRATIYASLVPAVQNKEAEQAKKFIIDLSTWKSSLDKNKINMARKKILRFHKKAPKVLDPFSGGGAIPLEALRLGCETYACDYNPVATMIVKFMVDIPFHDKYTKSKSKGGLKVKIEHRIISDVRKWGKWVLEEAKKDLSSFFPEENGDALVGYIWSRSIPCQNPKCGIRIPLIKQFYLVNKSDKKIILFPKIVSKDIQFDIIENEHKIPKGFDPKKGTISKGIAICLACGYSVESKKVKELFIEKRNKDLLNVVIVKHATRSGKNYRIAGKKDVDIFLKACQVLNKKQQAFQKKYKFEPIPTEPTPEGRGSGAERAFAIKNYNLNTWGELFNSRQKLVLLVFLEKILESYTMIKNTTMDVEHSRYVLVYLAIIFDKLASKLSNLSRYHTTGENIEHIFGRQALPMIWDYAELNPFASIGWKNMENAILQVLDHLACIDAKPGVVTHSSATHLPFSNEFFDAVITDPPYYDNIPYSYLSDFFYVWIKRLVGIHMPDLFSTPLTPKSDEAVVYTNHPSGHKDGKQFFEETLKKSFQEIFRVLKHDGIAIIVYAHKSTEGWETLINSLLQSGLIVTAAWPIRTEMKARLRAQDSATLASSIYMVARKWKKKSIGFYKDVKLELKRYLNEKLDHLWNEGISGADLFISAIGTAIEVFGKYDKILDDSDNQVDTTRLLNDIRKIVTDYAINKTIKGGISTKISKMTRFYILWRWAYGQAKVPFDDALKMSQSVGVSIENEWNKGFIIKDKGLIRVLGPSERKIEQLENADDLIDILHKTLLLWKKEKRKVVEEFLDEKGYKNSEVFRRVAQAISESLPPDSTEKKWLDGFLTGFDASDPNMEMQRKLF